MRFGKTAKQQWDDAFNKDLDAIQGIHKFAFFPVRLQDGAYIWLDYFYEYQMYTYTADWWCLMPEKVRTTRQTFIRYSHFSVLFDEKKHYWRYTATGGKTAYADRDNSRSDPDLEILPEEPTYPTETQPSKLDRKRK